MRLLRRVILVVPALSLFAAVAGCGGIVVFGEGGDGGGGNGTSVVSSGVGPTTDTTNVTASVSASTGPGGCDTGVPGSVDSFLCDQCIECSVGTECAAAYFGCIDDPRCLDWADCAFDCFDDACVDACTEAEPIGYQLYVDAIVCLYCQSCSVNCDGPSVCGF